jgi:uncharacterized protein YjbJ (UPF0337 family)
MSYIDNVGQKIKGKVQQVEGELNQMQGKRVKGGVQKLKGKLNVTAADIKMKTEELA